MGDSVLGDGSIVASYLCERRARASRLKKGHTHFGFYITSAACLKWTQGHYTDADLLLQDDDIGGIVTVRSPSNYYWVGSVKNMREALEVRAYGPRYCFRATVGSICKWAYEAGFNVGLIEPDGSTRFWGTLK